MMHSALVRKARVPLALVLAGVTLSTAAFAQQPTQAQIGAIRASCRADYPVVCAGVPTGGAAALQCLKKNVASVSAACQTAVNAVGGGAQPATTTANATAPAAAETSPPGAEQTAPPARTAVAPSAPPASEAIPAPPSRAHRQFTPRQELAVLRFACGSDFRALCGGVPPGGGRVISCLRDNGPSLSPRCRGVLARAF